MAPAAKDDDDASLVRQAVQGDFAAFDELVRKHQGRVFTLARRITGRDEDAAEVVQETFLRVMDHLSDFRHEAKFTTWLTRIATNEALQLLRKRKRLPSTGHSGGDEYSDIPRPEFIANWRDSPEEVAGRHEIRGLLSEALDELDEKYRTVFLLRDVQELSTAETAETLGISQSNVKVRLLRARLRLRERLTRALGDPDTQIVPDHDH